MPIGGGEGRLNAETLQAQHRLQRRASLSEQIRDAIGALRMEDIMPRNWCSMQAWLYNFGRWDRELSRQPITS